MTIGQRIENIRVKRGLTQTELATILGYKSRSSVCKIENETNMKINKVKKIANALNVPPSFLMGWTDEDGNELPDNTLKNNEILSVVRNDAQLSEIIANYIQLNKKSQSIMLDLSRILLNNCRE